MKQLKKLAFVMAFVMMVTLCAGAMASEDSTVEVNIKFIDRYYFEKENREVPARGSVEIVHAEDCCDEEIGIAKRSTYEGQVDVGVLPGHKYVITAGNQSVYNADPTPVTMRIPEEGQAVTFRQYIDYDPDATIELPAFKTMDGKAPGAQTFTFDIWKYSIEEFEAMEKGFASANFSSLDEAMAAYRSYHAAKKPYATATNDADGYIVFKPAVSPYDDGDDDVVAGQQLIFVAMERMEKGRPVCFDDAVYIYSTEVWLRDYGPKPEPKSMKAEMPKYRIGFSSDIQMVMGLSSERGYMDSENMEEDWVPDFQNRTCPFYNPPAAAETPAAPAVPQTGDNSPILVWLALACVSGMALLGMNRKKA